MKGQVLGAVSLAVALLAVGHPVAQSTKEAGSSNVSGTVCRPGGCNAGETVICGVQADCAQGTCTGMNTRAKNLGFCN